MSLLTILIGWFIRKKPKSLSRSAKINTKAEITGKVFIDDNAYIGHSKIISEDGCLITIGKETRIKDNILIKVNDSTDRFLKDVGGIFIGSKVFISSEVTINGPSIISDRTFIGSNTKIENSIIGSNCLIEEGVIIKNVIIPPETVIPQNSIIDSNEKLQDVLLKNKRDDYCEFTFTKTPTRTLMNKASI